ncbi:MAG TPA: MFS transporter [Phycisphaerales bacterium]|nr:MFS transporter [Phycisphaerales bacterium]
MSNATPTTPTPTEPLPVPFPAGPAPADAAFSAGRLAAHLIGMTLVQAVSQAVVFILPVLAIKHFGAKPWQSLLITATPTIFFTLSILWHTAFARWKFGSYMIAYWLLACLPGAAMALVNGYWSLLVLHLITCVGGAMWPPVSGELLRWLYADHLRGRAYGVVWGVTMIGGAVMGYGVGKWLTVDPEAFRIYMPIAAAVQLVGIVILVGLSRATGHAADRRGGSLGALSLRTITEPIVHMKQVLKADPVFARYEAAYMTYGVGWMIAYSLLPLLVTKKLGLDYEEIASSTHVAYLVALVAALYPAGLLLDKFGAIRGTGLSFFMLCLHPVGLMAARDQETLTIVSLAYGVAHSGASVGWMLGPVSLAPSKEKVAAYVAIHATLVGIRGKVFQALGVGLYMLTGVFWVPLLIAAAGYIWAGFQMFNLERFRQRRADESK